MVSHGRTRAVAPTKSQQTIKYKLTVPVKIFNHFDTFNPILGATELASDELSSFSSGQTRESGTRFSKNPSDLSQRKAEAKLRRDPGNKPHKSHKKGADWWDHCTKRYRTVQFHNDVKVQYGHWLDPHSGDTDDLIRCIREPWERPRGPQPVDCLLYTSPSPRD